MDKVKLFLIVLSLLCVLSSWATASDRMVLVELFTNTSCSYCYEANGVLDTLAEYYPDTVVVVRYHTWWPSATDPFYTYNTSENIARTNYYGVADEGVPYCQINGYIQGYPSTYWSIIYNCYNMGAPVEINLSGVYNATAGTGTIEVEVEATDIAQYDELYIRVALTESDLYYSAPNGTRYHDQAMRDMIPNAQGTSIEIDYGETVNLSIPFTIPLEDIDVDNTELVVWLQTDNTQTLEVYQAARIKPLDMEQVDIEDNAVKLPETFTLNQNYPNPFNATTTISYSLENQSSVDLAVYDLAGRKVAQLVSSVEAAGEHSIIWNGLNSDGNQVATGIYFYRLETDKERSTKRMVLLK